MHGLFCLGLKVNKTFNFFFLFFFYIYIKRRFLDKIEMIEYKCMAEIKKRVLFSQIINTPYSLVSRESPLGNGTVYASYQISTYTQYKGNHPSPGGPMQVITHHSVRLSKTGTEIGYVNYSSIYIFIENILSSKPLEEQ